MRLLYALARRLLGIQKKISREQALSIAQQECLRQGWAWKLPVNIHERLREYWIWTNANYIGGNCSLTVDLQTGQVINAGLIRR